MLRRVNLWLLHLILLVSLQGCGGCGEEERPIANPGDGDGDGDRDADMPDTGDIPIDVPDADSIYPGDPPEELEGEGCAADTNKIYELAVTSGSAQPAQLAVFAARVGMAFVSADDVMCTTGVAYAELFGPPGANEATPRVAYDDCTLVEQAAIARGDDVWLIAIVDNRDDARELWVHSFDPETGETNDRYRITDNMAAEGTVEMVRIDNEQALLVWAETAFDNSGTALRAQFLTGGGEPVGDVVEISEPGPGFYSSMSMAVLGEFYIGLVYKLDDGAGNHSIVLDVLRQDSGEREREPWVLTTEPGTNGTVDIAADSIGAGVAYTIVQGTSRQVWFQELGFDGMAVKIMGAGGLVGGPADPVRVVENPQLAIDISMTRMPRGYALAYRALPSVGVPFSQIRTHFLDRNGRIVGESAVALAEAAGGQTAIKMATDGRIVLSWMDTDEDGDSTLRALIVPCGS